jgi:hypothetical protein
MTPQQKLKTQKTVLGNAELRWNTVEDLRNLLAEAVIIRGHMVTARALHEHLTKSAWQDARSDLLDDERIRKVLGFRIGSWYCPMMPKFNWRFLEGLTFDEVVAELEMLIVVQMAREAGSAGIKRKDAMRVLATSAAWNAAVWRARTRGLLVMTGTRKAAVYRTAAHMPRPVATAASTTAGPASTSMAPMPIPSRPAVRGFRHRKGWANTIPDMSAHARRRMR